MKSVIICCGLKCYDNNRFSVGARFGVKEVFVYCF